MVAIYKYENGLHFTGKIAKTEQEAKDYLGKIYGKFEDVYTGEREADGRPIYEKRFVPKYNENAFVIKKVELV